MSSLSKLFFSALSVFFVFTLKADINYEKNRFSILEKRFGKEMSRLQYNQTVVENELDYAMKRYMKIKASFSKLKFLEKSSLYLRDYCPLSLLSCVKMYNMSIAYIRDEKKKVKKAMKVAESEMMEVKKRLSELSEKIKKLEKGLVIPTSERKNIPMPELSSIHNCLRIDSWNMYRGIFVPSSEKFRTPVKATVKSVTETKNGKYVVLLVEDYSIHYMYAGNIKVKKGQLLPAGKEIFKGSKANPVKKDSIIIFILKNREYVDPTFMCK